MEDEVESIPPSLRYFDPSTHIPERFDIESTFGQDWFWGQDQEVQIYLANMTASSDLMPLSKEHTWNTHASVFVPGRSEHHLHLVIASVSILDIAASDFVPNAKAHLPKTTQEPLQFQATTLGYDAEAFPDYGYLHSEARATELSIGENDIIVASHAWENSSSSCPDLDQSSWSPIDIQGTEYPDGYPDEYSDIQPGFLTHEAHEQFSHQDAVSSIKGSDNSAAKSFNVHAATFIPGTSEHPYSRSLSEGTQPASAPQELNPIVGVTTLSPQATEFVPATTDQAAEVTVYLNTASSDTLSIGTYKVSSPSLNPLAQAFTPAVGFWRPYSDLQQDTNLEADDEDSMELNVQHPEHTDEPPTENNTLTPAVSFEVAVNERISTAEASYGQRQGWILVDHDEYTDYWNYSVEELVDDGCVHHINFFGRPVFSKTNTSPAVSIAVLKSRAKNLHITGPYDLRKGAIMTCAMDLIDPVIYYGDPEILEKHHGTELENKCIGACEKFYSQYGWWMQDSWGLDEHRPQIDLLDPHTYSEDATVINGVTEGFPNRTAIITQSTDERIKEDAARMAAVKGRIARGCVKSRLGMSCISSEDLEEVPMFNTSRSATHQHPNRPAPIPILADTSLRMEASPPSSTTALYIKTPATDPTRNEWHQRCEDTLPRLQDWADESEELSESDFDVKVVRTLSESGDVSCEAVRVEAAAGDRQDAVGDGEQEAQKVAHVEAGGIQRPLEGINLELEAAMDIEDTRTQANATMEEFTPSESRRVSEASTETKTDTSRKSSLSEPKESPTTSPEPSDDEHDPAEVKAEESGNGDQGNDIERDDVAAETDSLTTVAERIASLTSDIFAAVEDVEAAMASCGISQDWEDESLPGSPPIPPRSPLRIKRRMTDGTASLTNAALSEQAKLPEVSELAALNDLLLTPQLPLPEGELESLSFRHVEGQAPVVRHFPNGTATMTLPAQRFGLVRSPEMEFPRPTRRVAKPVAIPSLAIIPEEEASLTMRENPVLENVAVEESSSHTEDGGNDDVAGNETAIEGIVVSPNVTIRGHGDRDEIPRRVIVADISPEETDGESPSSSTGPAPNTPPASSTNAPRKRRVRFAEPLVIETPSPCRELREQAPMRQPVSPAMRSLMRILEDYESYPPPSPCDQFSDFSGIHRTSSSPSTSSMMSFPPFGSSRSSPSPSASSSEYDDSEDDDDEQLSPVPRLPVFRRVRRRRLLSPPSTWGFLSPGNWSLRGRKGRAVPVFAADATSADSSNEALLHPSTSGMAPSSVEAVETIARSEGWIKTSLRKVKNAFVGKKASISLRRP